MSLLHCCYSVLQTPGPGHYGMPDTDKYKKRSPGYTMVGRYETRSKDIIPGPGAHSNDNVIRIIYTLQLYCPIDHIMSLGNVWTSNSKRVSTENQN